MDHIISYFGTYTAAAEGACQAFKFEYLSSMFFAAIVMLLGRAIVKRCAPLRKYGLPAPVISGLIFAIVFAILKTSGIIAISFDVSLIKDFAQTMFFTVVGYGCSFKVLKKLNCGPLMVKVAIGAVLIITLQDFVGVVAGLAVGMDPLLALQCSSASMCGGVATASAFGPIYEALGAQDATTVGVAAGTAGNLLASLVGGPIGAYLIHKHNLKSDPNDKPESIAKGGIGNPLDNNRMIHAFAMLLLIAGLGMPLFMAINQIPMLSLPKVLASIFLGVIARNVLDHFGIDTYMPEMEAQEHMWLELYLALVLMTIDITKLFGVAGQMGVVLLCQVILMALFAVFISFNLFGRDYGAAVMAAGNCGWSMGSGTNAVANEKALMDEYGWHTIAWVMYPSFAVLIDDIYNPIILSVLGNVFAH